MQAWKLLHDGEECDHPHGLEKEFDEKDRPT